MPRAGSRSSLWPLPGASPTSSLAPALAAGFALDAVASAGATSVTFYVTAVPLTATPTLYGWIYDMPATPPCGGWAAPGR